MHPEVPALFAHWEQFVGWLLDRTAKFPKNLRHTLTGRIDNLALDVFERLVEARYTRARLPLLARVNLDLEKLRLLLRLAHDRRVLDTHAFEHAMVAIESAGRQVGGWSKQQEARA